jgi:hypothetical protein
MTIPLTLDPVALARNEKWQQEAYDRSIKSIFQTIDWFVESMRRDVERYGADYEASSLGVKTESDVAAQLASTFLQGVGNVNLQGLIDIASELTTTKQARRALADLDPETQGLIIAQYEPERQQRDEERAAYTAKRAAERAAQCQASVHASGRGAGHHQCSRKGQKLTVVDGVEYRDCGRHPWFFPWEGD